MLIILKSHHAVVSRMYIFAAQGYITVRTKENLPFITLCRGCKGKKHAYSNDYKLASGFYDETSYIYGSNRETWEEIEKVAELFKVPYSKVYIDGKRGVKFSYCSLLPYRKAEEVIKQNNLENVYLEV